MRASLLLLGVFGCGGAKAADPVDNTGGVDRPHAPCYPDRETVTARELYEAASAGAPGTCAIVDAVDARGGESDLAIREIRDGDVRVGTFDPCGVEVVAPRITDERGIAVGDSIDAVVRAYPPAEIEYFVTGGLGGEAELYLAMQGLDVAWLELDGMGPPSGLDGDEAIEAVAGQRVASFRAVFMCD